MLTVVAMPALPKRPNEEVIGAAEVVVAAPVVAAAAVAPDKPNSLFEAELDTAGPPNGPKVGAPFAKPNRGPAAELAAEVIGKLEPAADGPPNDGKLMPADDDGCGAAPNAS